MYKNAYQGGEIRKAAEPLDDTLDTVLVVFFCLVPVICLVVAVCRI